MKILHLTCVRELTSGQRKQLNFEYESSKKLSLDWTVKALHTGKIIDKRFEQKIPRFFNKLILRNLYAWLYILKNQKKYDVVINRHMTFDPFILIFGWFIKNRFTVHHAKEIEELRLVRKGLKGKVASFIEKVTGFISLKQIKGAICVTNDIEVYQNQRANVKTFLYPNGIDLSLIKVMKDKRISSEINIAFMCGTFSEWHGLDLLIDSIAKNLEFIETNNVKIHLIGRVLQKELDFINKNKLPVFLYGVIPSEEYIEVLEKCDIGLDSLALNRKKLLEAAALKVREYLSLGLPIYSAYKDAALTLDFKYYKIGEVDVIKMVEFSKEMKQISRQDIRNLSENYISKEILLKKLYTELKDYCSKI